MFKSIKILINLIGIIIFAMLLKNNNLNYNILGIIGIYFSVYFFINLNTKEFENFKLQEIITIFISYMLQKTQFLLYKNVYKNKVFFTLNIIMILVFTCFFLYKLYKTEEKISLKKALELFHEFLIISMPFFFIIGSKFAIVISVISLIKNFRKKEYIWDKDIRGLYFSIFCLFLFSATSFIGNEFDSGQIFLSLFIQMKFSDINIKKILKIGVSASIIPIVPVLIQFLQIRNFSYRYGEDNPNTWGLEAALWAGIFLYIVFFKKKKEYMPLYVLYIFTTILSGSKGPILALIIVNILMFIYRFKNQKKMLAAIFLSSILIVYGILNTNNRISYSINLIRKEKTIDSSSATRIVIYKEAIAQFKEKPINGVGFNGYRNNSIKRNLENNTKELSYVEQAGYSQAHAHSNILNLLCTTGILGVLSYLSMYFFILKKIFKSFSTNKYSILILGLILTYELCGLVDCTMFNGSQQLLMLFITGLYIAYVSPKIKFSKKEKSV